MDIAVIVLLTTAFGQFLKKKVYPMYGEVGVHLLIFFIALFFAAVWSTIQGNPEFGIIADKAFKVLLMASGLYEVLLKKIAFSSTKELLEQ